MKKTNRRDLLKGGALATAGTGAGTLLGGREASVGATSEGKHALLQALGLS